MCASQWKRARAYDLHSTARRDIILAGIVDSSLATNSSRRCRLDLSSVSAFDLVDSKLRVAFSSCAQRAR